jgi:NDP-sugar pyrophosphorylase family protein
MSGMFPVAILAGGLATRLRPLTNTIPKALVEIRGEPFITHQLRLLHAHGISRVVICAGYRGEQIVDVVGDGARLGLDVAYSFDGPQLLGTAGAIQRALPQLGESFFVLYGDSYLECDYGAIQHTFEASGKTGLMTVYRNHGQWDTSNVEYVGGKILAYDKQQRTPRMQYIDYGLGVLLASAFQGLAPDQPHDLEGVYQTLLQQDQLAACQVTQRFYEVGSPSGIAELEHYLAVRNR